MKMQGKATFWGKEIGENISEKGKRLLGYDDGLHMPGRNGDITDRKQALAIIDQPERRNMNARQTFLMHKRGHGTGEGIDIPNEEEINRSMQ